MDEWEERTVFFWSVETCRNSTTQKKLTEKRLEPFTNANRLRNGKHAYQDADGKLTGGMEKRNKKLVQKRVFFFQQKSLGTNHLGTACHVKSLAGHRFAMTLACTTCRHVGIHWHISHASFLAASFAAPCTSHNQLPP